MSLSHMAGALLCTLTVAGCLGNADAPADDGAALAPEGTGLERRLGNGTGRDAAIDAPTPAYDRDDWFVMGTTTNPEGSIQAFEWTVPTGAIIRYNSGFDWTTMYLEVAPIAGDVLPDAWALFVFRQSGGEADLLNILFSTEHDITTIAAPVFSYDGGVSLYPTYVSTPFDSVTDGDTLFFVVAARTPAASEFAVAFRILDRSPWAGSVYEWPAEDTDDFLAARQEDAVLPTKRGTGNGLVAADFHDSALLYALDYRAVSRDAVLGDSSPLPYHGAVEVRDTTVSASASFDAGFSYGYAWYLAGEAGAGQWSADMDCHGLPFSHDGIVARLPSSLALATTLLVGYPFFSMVGDGEGGCSTELAVQAVAAGGAYLTYTQLTLGADTEALFGLPVETGIYTYTGLIGLDEAPDGSIVSELDGVRAQAAPTR